MRVVTIYSNMWGSYNVVSFTEVGLRAIDTFYDFEVIDEKLFFLSVIKYGITYKTGERIAPCR